MNQWGHRVERREIRSRAGRWKVFQSSECVVPKHVDQISTGAGNMGESLFSTMAQFIRGGDFADLPSDDV